MPMKSSFGKPSEVPEMKNMAYRLVYGALEQKLYALRCAFKDVLWHYAQVFHDGNPELQYLIERMQNIQDEYESIGKDYREDDEYKNIVSHLAFEMKEYAAVQTAIVPLLQQMKELKRTLRHGRKQVEHFRNN